MTTIDLTDDEIGILVSALEGRGVGLRIGKARSESAKGRARIDANEAVRVKILAAWASENARIHAYKTANAAHPLPVSVGTDDE